MFYALNTRNDLAYEVVWVLRTHCASSGCLERLLCFRLGSLFALDFVLVKDFNNGVMRKLV